MQTTGSLVFDRALVLRHRERAAPHFAAHDVLAKEIANHLLDRLGDVKRTFRSVLCMEALDQTLALHFAAMQRAGADEAKIALTAGDLPLSEILPNKAGAFDLILSNSTMHWVNDVPGALIQMRQALQADGLFLAALFGGETLRELRSCLLDAELAIAGGVSPRVSPVLDLPTASALLQRAGFSLPVTDHEIITLTYPDMFALLRDLRGMGEANAHLQRSRRFARRAVFGEAARLYQERYGQADGQITATFEVIYWHGWR
ncbi:MAG: methyltransferase domain-containing protein [Pseudomonadota bacterium]|nr:methyltransferase domain-containing protein [Pseudomonadota bacterium]